MLVVYRVTGNYAVNGLVQPANRTAAHHVWLIESSILADTGRAVVFYGLVMVLGGILAGPHSFAISFRRWLAPTLARRPGMSWGILAGAYLLLVLWGPTHALRTVWGVLLLGALVAVGFEALRRQTLAENPDAAERHGEATATMKALGARAAAHRPQRSSASRRRRTRSPACTTCTSPARSRTRNTRRPSSSRSRRSLLPPRPARPERDRARAQGTSR